MPHPTTADFKAILLRRSLDEVVREFIFEGMPYVFRDHPNRLEILRRHLCDAMPVSWQNVIVVGSGKIGFSLNHDTFFRQFSEESDIDIVVIDDSLFDKVWKTLLAWHYPRKGTDLGGVDGAWARERRKDLYWGCFMPHEIKFEGLSFPSVLKPLRDISTTWFNAFQSLSLYEEFASRVVSGRLYRSWDHALLYHMEGLRQIREVIRLPNQESNQHEF